MLEPDEYLRLVASNFKIAEAHLKDTEDALHTLVENQFMLDFLIPKVKHELLLSEQMDAFVRDSQPAGVRELQPVGS